MIDSFKKTARKQWILFFMLTLGFVALLMFGLWISDPNRGKLSALETARLEAQEVIKNYEHQHMSVISDEESWISKSEKELMEYKLDNKALRKSISALEKKLGSLESKWVSVEKNYDRKESSKIPPAPRSVAYPAIQQLDELPPVPHPDELKKLPMGFPEALNTNKHKDIKQQVITQNIVPPRSSSIKEGHSSIEVFNFNATKKGLKKDKMVKNVSHYIPSGSFGRIVLLSGVDAPTGGEAKNNPVPILMRLLDHGTLPNYFSSEIKDCHVTGDARGDLSSERVKIRTERLSCVLINGDVVEVKVKGWVNGEDGSEGFRGKVVEKTGSLLAKSFVSGVFSGLSNNVGSQFQNISQSPLGTITTIDPGDAGKAGIAAGIETSTEKLADYYMDRANEMYPIIEASANRIGELVLQVGVDLERNIIGNMGDRS